MADHANSTPTPNRERSVDRTRLRGHLRPLEMESADARIVSYATSELLNHIFRDRTASRDLLDVYQVTGEQVEALRMFVQKTEEASRGVALGIEDLVRAFPLEARQ